MEDLVELADLALSECGLDVVTDEELARRYESRVHVIPCMNPLDSVSDWKKIRNSLVKKFYVNTKSRGMFGALFQAEYTPKEHLNQNSTIDKFAFHRIEE
jgi:hypothetical protein